MSLNLLRCKIVNTPNLHLREYKPGKTCVIQLIARTFGSLSIVTITRRFTQVFDTDGLTTLGIDTLECYPTRHLNRELHLDKRIGLHKLHRFKAFRNSVGGAILRDKLSIGSALKSRLSLL